MRRRAFGTWALMGLLGLLFGGCKGEAKQRLVVFAASSLREAFTQASEDFGRIHPGVEVVFHFAGTQELRAQIEHGARADVFASADSASMEALGGDVEAPVVFARNDLVLVITEERAATFGGFGDLPNMSRVVVGVLEAPIGRYTAQMLASASASGEWGPDFGARVEAKVASRELNTKQVLTRVVLGEADAGVVYRTDARAAKGVAVVEIPKAVNVVASYPMAALKGSGQAELAREWVAFMSQGVGQESLLDAGFLSP